MVCLGVENCESAFFIELHGSLFRVHHYETAANVGTDMLCRDAQRPLNQLPANVSFSAFSVYREPGYLDCGIS